MARSKSSGRWLQEHFQDEFVKRSKRDGYRSRASYKLLELIERDRLVQPGMVVLDLGAAPGGWSQVVAGLVGPQGKVIASDLLPMDPIPGVRFIQGDFVEQSVFDEIVRALGNEGADLVISDMAPNMSGMKAVDIPRAMYLAELAADMAKAVLKPGGSLMVKVFQGEGIDALRETLKRSFSSLKSRKPEASRGRSREQYLLASGFKGAMKSDG